MSLDKKGMLVIYVDDEPPAAARFNMLIKDIAGVALAKTFIAAADALDFAEQNSVDIAFLDVEMPGMTGIELARRLKDINPSTRIIILTAYEEYALEAFEADAIGYLLKPYGREKLERAISKARLVRDAPGRRVYIKTFGGFDVFIDGKLLKINSLKPKELLALLVSRRGGSVTSGQAICALWEERPKSDAAGALYRMTGKRLRELLAAAGIARILAGDGYRAVDPTAFECDYYEFLEHGGGEHDAFMPEYSWAEDINALMDR